VKPLGSPLRSSNRPSGATARATARLRKLSAALLETGGSPARHPNQAGRGPQTRHPTPGLNPTKATGTPKAPTPDPRIGHYPGPTTEPTSPLAQQSPSR
jgi:hypothetical protein